MANRTQVLEILRQYMKDKGRILPALEYGRQDDCPIRLHTVTRLFGSWSRLEKLIMAHNVDDLIRDRQAAEYAQWVENKKIGEDQDAKAEREAEAQAVAEVLAKNAATPEGANANKVAIGGKLPQEQQDYSAIGATVSVNPKTGEQTVIDTKPEEVNVDGFAEDDKTPPALVEKAKAKVGEVPVDKSTAGEK